MTEKMKEKRKRKGRRRAEEEVASGPSQCNHLW